MAYNMLAKIYIFLNSNKLNFLFLNIFIYAEHLISDF